MIFSKASETGWSRSNIKAAKRQSEREPLISLSARTSVREGLKTRFSLRLANVSKAKRRAILGACTNACTWEVAATVSTAQFEGRVAARAGAGPARRRATRLLPKKMGGSSPAWT